LIQYRLERQSLHCRQATSCLTATVRRDKITEEGREQLRALGFTV